MAEFVRSLPEDGPTDTTRRFFPTTGDWSYTHTVHLAGGGTRIQRWVFPAAQTSLLFGFDKGVKVDPVRESFQADPHGQTYGLLISIIETTGRRWRLAGRNRFVPPGAPVSSPVFVEWRREHGQWVISAFGDERHCSPRLRGYVRGDVVAARTLPEPAQPAYAANEGWYVNNEILRFDVRRYAKYGLPREIQRGELEQLGWKDDVRVYVEKGASELPLVVYLPTAPGMYQPYLEFGRGPDPYCPR